MIYIKLIWAYIKIGIFGFGGGYAMLSLVEHSVVDPGTVSPELYSGTMYGILGSLLCTLAVVIPSYLMVLYASHFIARHRESGTIKHIFAGLRPVVVGLIASAAILLMNNANFNPNGIRWQLISNILICIAAFLLVYFPIPWKGRKIKLHPILVIIIAGITGFLLYGI